MIEEQKQRVEQEVSKMFDEIDKSFLRKMQAEMHYCAAKCCENRNLSLDGLQRCVDNCSKPVNKAQSYVQGEIGEFQHRLQRCIMLCNDDVKVQIPNEPTENDIAKFTSQFEVCAVRCVDKHVALIPNILNRIKDVMAKSSYRMSEF